MCSRRSFSLRSPLAEWNFNEGIGNSAHDTGTGIHTGTINGATWVNGKSGKALNFDSDNDYVQVPDHDYLSPPQGLTISLWVYPNSLPPDNTNDTRRGLVDKYDFAAGQRAYSLVTSKDYLALTVSQTLNPFNGKETRSTQPLSLKKWTHVVATFKADEQRIYLNGKLDVLDTNTAIANSIPNNTTPLLIGKMTDSGKSFDGLIDNVKIYGYVRSPAQIAWDYNQGAPTAH